MGQYFIGVVLKKDWNNNAYPIRATLNPQDFYNGSKLMEHSYVNNSYVQAFQRLVSLLDDGKGVPCVWAGDYAPNISTKALPIDDNNIYTVGLNVWRYAYNWNKETGSQSSLVKDIITLNEKDKLFDFKYILNRTKKEYVIVPEDDPLLLVIHPLPMLLATGNEEGGGGSYQNGTDMDKIGSWAFDYISLTNNPKDIPNNYKELKCEFKKI